MQDPGRGAWGPLNPAACTSGRGLWGLVPRIAHLTCSQVGRLWAGPGSTRGLLVLCLSQACGWGLGEMLSPYLHPCSRTDVLHPSDPGGRGCACLPPRHWLTCPLTCLIQEVLSDGHQLLPPDST